MISHAIYGGRHYSRQLDDWSVEWESKDDYRLWCTQHRGRPSKWVAFVLFNPGSLSHDGTELKKDTTLRNVRDCLPDNSVGALVLNLFTLATPNPPVLFERWLERDCPGFSLNPLSAMGLDAVAFAYGDLHEDKKVASFRPEIILRIADMRKSFAHFPTVSIPLNQKYKNPSHAMNWRRNHHIESVTKAIQNALSTNTETAVRRC